MMNTVIEIAAMIQIRNYLQQQRTSNLELDRSVVTKLGTAISKMDKDIVKSSLDVLYPLPVLEVRPAAKPPAVKSAAKTAKPRNLKKIKQTNV